MSTPLDIRPSADWIEALPSCVVVVVDEHIRYANTAATRLLDAAAPGDLIGQPIDRYIHPLDLHRSLSRLRKAANEGLDNPVTEFRGQTATGRQIVFVMSSSPISVEGVSGVLCSFLDITERAWMEAQLKETDQNFQRIMNTMQDVFYRTDAQGITRYVCPAVKNVLGYSAEEICGQPAASFYPDLSERDALVAEIRAKGFAHDFPGRMRRKDGTIIDISVSTHALQDDHGQYAGVEGIWRDITQRKTMERELERLATRDSLTGLANRGVAMQALTLSFERRGGRRESAPSPYSVLIFDLDHFKVINDTYGHVAGDQVLRHIADLVTLQCRTTDTFGRVGGEEFLLVLENTEMAVAHEIAERVRAAIADTPVAIPGGDQRVAVTASIGVAQYLETDTNPTDIFERADRLLYQAKLLGRNRVVIAF